MISFLGLLLHALASPFKSQARLEAEIVFLRHQLNLLRRRLPAKPRLTPADRLLFVWLYRLVPSLLNAAVIIQPDTIVRWHRAVCEAALPIATRRLIICRSNSANAPVI
jgi:hypothetical protein